MKFTDSKAALEFECPISLSPLYCPITVKNSKPRRSYSGPIITELTRTSKVDPLTGEPLLPGWKVQDFQLDKSLATQSAVIPLTFGGESLVLPLKKFLCTRETENFEFEISKSF